MAAPTFQLIVNPFSGGTRSGRLVSRVARDLTRRDAQFLTTYTESLEHGKELAQSAAEAGDIPVAVGGDGLVSAVCDAVARVNGTVGIVPAGRGNDFAKHLGLQDPEHAVQVLLSGHISTIDLGRIDDRYFTTVASLGLDSDVLSISQKVKAIKGSAVYAYSSIRALMGWKPMDFTVTVDGQRHELRGYNVVVANASYYGGGMRMAPDASIDDGLFDVVHIADLPRAQLLWHMPKVFGGTHTKIEAVHVWRGSQVTVDTANPVDIWADGEKVARTPAAIELVPNALKIYTPQR